MLRETLLASVSRAVALRRVKTKFILLALDSLTLAQRVPSSASHE